MTQQSLSKISPSPARNGDAVVENLVSVDIPERNSSDKEALQVLRNRFIQYGECSCPEELEDVSFPYKCNVKLVYCKICNKNKEKIYL